MTISGWYQAKTLKMMTFFIILLFECVFFKRNNFIPNTFISLWTTNTIIHFNSFSCMLLLLYFISFICMKQNMQEQNSNEWSESMKKMYTSLYKKIVKYVVQQIINNCTKAVQNIYNEIMLLIFLFFFFFYTWHTFEV